MGVKNGWIDPYPHNDFDGPCTGPCCFPEAYPEFAFTCAGEGCYEHLKYRGLCVSCAEKQGALEEPVFQTLGDLLLQAERKRRS